VGIQRYTQMERTAMAKSWKAEVIADDTGKWVSNALRFATKEQAEHYVRDLSLRWFAVRETRVVESDDDVTIDATVERESKTNT